MSREDPHVSQKFFPPKIDLLEILKVFKEAAAANLLLGKVWELCEQRKFTDEKGRIDYIGDASISLEEASILHFLTTYLDADVTIETGFGGGGSACVFVGSKKQGAWAKGHHTSIDPYGLGNGKGAIVESYLQRNFKRKFTRVREVSEVALPRLVSDKIGKVKLSHIDGGHLFEHALMDFVFLDRMCALGGCIVIDDASAPAVRSAINYIIANRSDYEIQRPNSDTALLWKIQEKDDRNWDHFRPFDVAKENDWGHEHDYR